MAQLSSWRLFCDGQSVRNRSIFGDAAILAFVLAQAADGVFTYLGIALFGTSIEGNPLVAWYVGALGAGTAVFGAKIFAVACGATLHYRSMHRTIAALTIIYLTAAVWPWTRTLFY